MHLKSPSIPPPHIATAISSLSGDPSAAASLFLSILRRPSRPTQSAISALLKILSFSSLHLPLGLQLHSLSLKLSLSPLPFSGSALVSFYSRHRLPDHALKAFAEIPHPDSACFAAAIVCLARNRRPAKALSFFRRMRAAGIASTTFSVASAVAAAAETAALQQSCVLHAHAVVSGLGENAVVATALLVAYGKAGVVADARRAFDEIRGAGKANLVTWNALLCAYGQQGDAASARQVFDEMRGRNFRPDEYTFLAVLAACGSSGLVDEIEIWLKSMRGVYGVEPRLEHYSCLVGAMARAGRLGDAERFVEAMPVEPDAAVWRTLLSAAMIHGDADVGGRAAGRLLEIDPRDDSAYVMLGKIYNAVGRKGEMAEVWRRMRDEGVRKEGGRSWIEVAGGVHVFVAGDRMHERSSEIRARVRELERETRELGCGEGGGGDDKWWRTWRSDGGGNAGVESGKEF